jgi:hypothetical protein
MVLIEEFTRKCLAIRVARRINSFRVLDPMTTRPPTLKTLMPLTPTRIFWDRWGC